MDHTALIRILLSYFWVDHQNIVRLWGKYCNTSKIDNNQYADRCCFPSSINLLIFSKVLDCVFSCHIWKHESFVELLLIRKLGFTIASRT